MDANTQNVYFYTPIAQRLGKSISWAEKNWDKNRLSLSES